MTPTPLADPAALQLLTTVDVVRAQLADVADRLHRLGPELDDVVAATDWQTDAARRFHHAADSWRQDVAALTALVEASADELRWLSARVSAMIWSGLP